MAVFSLVPVSSCSKSSFFPPCSMKQQEEQTVTRCNTLMMIYSTIGFQGLAATSILAFILPAWMQLWQKKKKSHRYIFFFFFSLSKASTCGIMSCSQLGKKKCHIVHQIMVDLLGIFLFSYYLAVIEMKWSFFRHSLLSLVFQLSLSIWLWLKLFISWR